MQTTTETVRSDALHVVEPRAAGPDVHKLQVTLSIRLCEPGGGPTASAPSMALTLLRGRINFVG